MPKKDHLSGLADLGQEAGSSQLQSFITVHRHTMVWVPSLPLNPRLSVTPVLALHPSFPLFQLTTGVTFVHSLLFHIGLCHLPWPLFQSYQG